ncbi:uncharacterized protein PV09_08899 [Verruconis gallopava]|uniref:Uncharacterized protein n=1 Tax=Verruconis gallopava TaxID=253628 RepID=A0A0D1ZZM2_9PEZI|nr:uncharacterized protein PV09_08899 [Verruconis gallopava]KIV99479.1 hypothetical protein PV09_08899 [Verruconis gallopava]
MPPKSIVPDVSKDLSGNTNLSDEDAAKVQRQLDSAIDSAFSGGQAQAQADEARRRAAKASTPAEREKYEQEAAEYERQAQSQLKTSRRLQSGAWQGFGAGAGIGAATGMGLGGIVGTLSGGVLAVPLTAVGGLIGASTGFFHGPWIKLTRGEDGPQIEAAEEDEPGAVKLEPNELDAINKGLAQGVANLGDARKAAPSKGLPIRNSPKPGRKPPRKLEVREHGK